MSEYIQIETELSDDGHTIYFYTNLPLTSETVEHYESPEDMEVGSPLAQAFTICTGIERLTIEGSEIAIIKSQDIDWFVIVEDVSAILKDFFL